MSHRRLEFYLVDVLALEEFAIGLLIMFCSSLVGTLNKDLVLTIPYTFPSNTLLCV